MRELEGKVVAVTFLFTSCVDVCPLLTSRLVDVQDELGEAFGAKVVFVAITVDPEVDRPPVLERYAEDMGCDPAGWIFATGTSEQIRKVAHAYGVFFRKRSRGDVDHNLLTTLVDRRGTMRVQYMGEAFDAGEFEQDLRSLMREPGPP